MSITVSQLFKAIEYGEFDNVLDNIKTMIELREQEIEKEKEI